jgi:hypothetical protein
MKRARRKQLTFYCNQSPRAKLMEKKLEFPQMLKKLFKSLNVKEYLPAAFKTFGLHPSMGTKSSSVSLRLGKLPTN